MRTTSSEVSGGRRTKPRAAGGMPLWAAALAIAALTATVTTGCPGPEPQLAASGGGGGSVGGSGAGGSGGDETGGGATGGHGGSGGVPNSCPEMDVLVVIDNTSSMNDLVDGQFFITMGSLQSAFEARFDTSTSLRVGFVTATEHTQNPPQCQTLGALSTYGGLNGQDDCVTAEGGPFITEADATGSLASLFLCMAVPGQGNGGEGNERAIGALLAALDNSSEPALSCNGGFSRPGVPLVVVIAADEDDALTPGTPQQWMTDLLAIKQVDKSQLGLVALVPDTGDCVTPGPGPVNLHAFALQFDDQHHYEKDLCNLSGENLETTINALWDVMCPSE